MAIVKTVLTIKAIQEMEELVHGQIVIIQDKSFKRTELAKIVLTTKKQIQTLILVFSTCLAKILDNIKPQTEYVKVVQIIQNHRLTRENVYQTNVLKGRYCYLMGHVKIVLLT